VASAATVHAQTFVKPTLPSAVPQATAYQTNSNTAGAEDVAVKTATISHVLESGRTLELGGHWADALTKYEEALHEYPEDQRLQGKFDVARLHYSLEQRYDDRSFRDALRTMKPQQSLELYNDLLSKIEQHYYTAPPWQEIAQRGAAALDIALQEENFLRNQSIRVRGQQIEQLRADILQLPGRYRISSSRDVAAIATQIARLAQQ